MTEKKGFWIVLQIGTLILYTIILCGSYLIHQSTPGWILVGLLVVLHLSEMRIAIPVARERGVSQTRAFLMNLLFGFTWWVPLRKGIIQK